MNDQAAIQGDYTDIRFIKGRKVCAITVEIPIEAGAEFVAMFGTPNPATGVPVAVARIVATPAPEIRGGKLCQRAAILSKETAFQKFILETKDDVLQVLIIGKEEIGVDCATVVRTICGVTSRAELDHNDEAARKFLNLEASYKAWLTQ